jgi:hypothetical protein
MAYASGRFSADGDAQTSLFVLRRTTTNATPAELFLDGSGARITVPSGRTMTFDILITARGVQPLVGALSAGYHIRGVIENGGGTTAFIGGVPATTTLGEDVPAWDATVEANDTLDALVIKVTGAAAILVRWVAVVRKAEVAE